MTFFISMIFGMGISLAPRAAGWASPLGHRNIVVEPGSHLAEIVNRQPPGTVFTIKAGVYRLESIRPKDGDSFVGEPGATLNGAQLLEGFVRSGQIWQAPTEATPPRGQLRGTCDSAHPACTFPEDLFFDDKPLERVNDRGDVAPGKWYLDYSAQIVVFADDPTGHRVELSVIPHAIWGAARNVRISGMTIEKYACTAGSGAVDGRSNASDTGYMSTDWVVENNVIRLNHGVGIRLGNGMQALNNKILNNGQLGIAGSGTGDLVEGNEIAFNNYAGYRYDWEAGGSKFAFTKDLVVRDNFAHDNKGPGLWTDIDNQNTLYDHNHTKSNEGAGILHEISYHAVIRDNLIENDGFSAFGKTTPWYGGGIVVAESADVEIFGNTVKDCMNGIVGVQEQRSNSAGEPYSIRNLYVHDNTIIQDRGIAAGIVRTALLGDAVFDSFNNRFSDNHFQLATNKAKSFAWKGDVLSYGEWTLAMNQH